MSSRRYLTTGIAAVYFGALIGMTFMTGSGSPRAWWFWPFIFFIPVGVLLIMLMGPRRWWVALGFGVLGAAWIEAAQVIWMPEGYASVIDMLWGSAGVVVGVVLALLVALTQRNSIRSHESHRMMSQSGNREIPQD